MRTQTSQMGQEPASTDVGTPVVSLLDWMRITLGVPSLTLDPA